MKSKFLFVAAAATIIISYLSCNLFDSSSKKESPLIGKWQVVNFADSSKDSSKNDIGLLLMSMSAKDTQQVQFNADSSMQVFTSKENLDSGKYVFDEKQLTIFGKNDTTVFKINKLKADSLQLFTLKDSITYSLHKLQ